MSVMFRYLKFLLVLVQIFWFFKASIAFAYHSCCKMELTGEAFCPFFFFLSFFFWWWDVKGKGTSCSIECELNE